MHDEYNDPENLEKVEELDDDDEEVKNSESDEGEDDDSDGLPKPPKVKKDKSYGGLIRDSEILRTQYGISSVDIEIVQLTEYRIIEIVNITNQSEEE